MDCGKGFGPGFFPPGDHRFKHHFRNFGKMMAQKFPEWFEKIKAFGSTYVVDDGEYIIVEIDMPGFEKDDIDLKAGDYYLEVSAEREHNEEEIKLRGTEKKTFKVNVRLPSRAKVDDVKAVYRNGVLRVVLKKEPEKKVDVN
ncbi:MAG: Hsp20/alpha crystallin family protein [Candidatus Lokiarchaeia archaeon]